MSTGQAGLNAAWGIYDKPQTPLTGRPDAPSRNHVWMRVCSSLPGYRARGCCNGWWTAHAIDDPRRYYCNACNAAHSPTRIIAEGWRGGAVASAYAPAGKAARTKAKREAIDVERAAELLALRAVHLEVIAVDRSTALSLYVGGLSAREAAAVVGRSKSTVTGWVQAAGVARPRVRARGRR